MAAEGDNVTWYNYTGDRRVPDDVTHVTIDASVTVIPEDAFRRHPNIVEVICHDKVERVEARAFISCPSLRRVIMPGVEVVEGYAFDGCKALAIVECGKLEIIKEEAFNKCTSLMSIDLLSAKVIKMGAFTGCFALTNAKFGSKLERIEEMAFDDCPSLARITIPLKDGIITNESIFYGCDNLKHVELVEGATHETIAALQLEEWRNDMNEEIDSINQILPTASAGRYGHDDGGIARAIRGWIRSVLGKIIHYQAEHRRYLNEEIATALQLVLPQDIVMNNVLPFVYLPLYTFEVVDEEEYWEEVGTRYWDDAEE
eukprot:scaffold211_cov83-Skeletonema_dohrnii-CCMP3373.AAC.7